MLFVTKIFQEYLAQLVAGHGLHWVDSKPIRLTPKQLLEFAQYRIRATEGSASGEPSR
jgi:hypothetical protein